jgi:hypothetical protein
MRVVWMVGRRVVLSQRRTRVATSPGLCFWGFGLVVLTLLMIACAPSARSTAPLVPSPTWGTYFLTVVPFTTAGPVIATPAGTPGHGVRRELFQ